MENTQILKKAIEKAVKNGWEKKKLSLFIRDIRVEIKPFNNSMQVCVSGLHPKDKGADHHHRGLMTWNSKEVIFSHDFAKAFWSYSDWKKNPNSNWISHERYWQENLQQMVLEKDPLKYLKKFL